MDKQVTVIVNGCELYDGNKKYSNGMEYTCSEEEANRLVLRKLVVLKDTDKNVVLKDSDKISNRKKSFVDEPSEKQQ